MRVIFLSVLLAVPSPAQLGPLTIYAGNQLGTAVNSGDFNGDGREDVLVVSGGSVGVMLANRDGSLAPPFPGPGFDVANAATTDLDGNGLDDLVAAYGGNLHISFCRPGCSGTPVIFDTSTLPLFWNTSVVGAVGTDVWVWEGPASRIHRLTITPPPLPGMAPGVATTETFVVPCTQPVGFSQLCNLNGDGWTDVTISCGLSIFGGSTLIYLGSPSGLIPNPGASTVPWDAEGAADLNGDGLDELLCNLIVGGGPSVQMNLGPGPNGGVSFVAQPLVPNRVFLDLGDVDGDGDIDLVLEISPTSSQRGFALNDGQGNFTVDPATFPSTGIPWLSDLDGNGRPDLILGGNVTRTFMNLTLPIQPSRPGTADGLTMQTTSSHAWPDPAPDTHKWAQGGDLLTAQIDVPGAFVGETLLLAVDLMPTSCPGPLFASANIHVGPQAVPVPFTVPATGTVTYSVIAPSMPPCTSAVVQGIIITAGASNGTYAASPAHEFQFR